MPEPPPPGRSAGNCVLDPPPPGRLAGSCDADPPLPGRLAAIGTDPPLPGRLAGSWVAVPPLGGVRVIEPQFVPDPEPPGRSSPDGLLSRDEGLL